MQRVSGEYSPGHVPQRPASLPGGRFRWMWNMYGELEDFDKVQILFPAAYQTGRSDYPVFCRLTI